MPPSPVGSFTKFVIGFLIFISVSLGITVAVNVYTSSRDKADQTANAIQAMLKQQK
jgi:hypothetical protein